MSNKGDEEKGVGCKVGDVGIRYRVVRSRRKAYLVSNHIMEKGVDIEHALYLCIW